VDGLQVVQRERQSWAFGKYADFKPLSSARAVSHSFLTQRDPAAALLQITTTASASASA